MHIEGTIYVNVQWRRFEPMQGHPISAHLRTQIITQTSILISPLSANFEDTRIPLKVEASLNDAFPQVRSAGRLSTRVLFFICNQSEYDPGRDRTRDQWYRSWTFYHKATAAVGLGGKFGKFILYIFIPRSVNE